MHGSLLNITLPYLSDPGCGEDFTTVPRPHGERPGAGPLPVPHHCLHHMLHRLTTALVKTRTQQHGLDSVKRGGGGEMKHVGLSKRRVRGQDLKNWREAIVRTSTVLEFGTRPFSRMNRWKSLSANSLTLSSSSHEPLSPCFLC